MEYPSESVNIVDLPHELLELILKHLDIRSLVKFRARLKSIVEQFKIYELNIDNGSNTPWRFINTCDRIAVKNTVEHFNARQIGTLPLDLSNLKQLQVSSIWDSKERKGQFYTTVTMTPLYIYVHDVNKFTQLVQLRLDSISASTLENRVLHLPKLKILDLWPANDIVIVDAPCLKSLNTCKLDSVHLLDPTTVEFIKCLSIKDGEEILAAYKGVTQLKLHSVLSLLDDEHILQSLPNLQMFDGDQDDKYKTEREQYYYTYKLVKKFYDNLVKEKHLLQRNGLKICFGQIEIEDGKRFEDYGNFRDYFDC